MRSTRLLVTTAVSGALVLIPFVASGSASTSTSTASCAGAVSWSSATRMIGKVATVKGPVQGTNFASGSSGSPTLLNLGHDYPNPNRFQVVIWIEDRGKFGTPERRYHGRTICVRGLIKSYRGVPEIVARSPSQIAVA